MSPQFHLVFDDYFERVFSDEGQEQAIWAELITFQTFRSDYDDEDYVPELSNEWLNPERDSNSNKIEAMMEHGYQRFKNPWMDHLIWGNHL
jgi:hypothetical protein